MFGENRHTNKYKNVMGQYLLRDLFYEFRRPGSQNAIYTAKDWDHEGLPSLKRLYMACDDMTEYSFAVEYMDGIEHWERLCECPWFVPLITQWRKELSLRVKSIALSNIIKEAQKDGPSKLSANKYILEQGWTPKTGANKRGRPSKADIAEAAQDIVTHDERLKADMARLEAEDTNRVIN